MDKPNALLQVLDDLRQEGNDSSAVTVRGSYAKIYLTAGADPITLSREESELALNTPASVELVVDALGSPLDASIELHQLTIDDAVQDALERSFAAVDEI